jgi:choice-of-anchor A domain-containing protein
MAKPCRFPLFLLKLTFFVIILSLKHESAHAQHKESINAFIPAAHKTIFDAHNLFVLGDLNIAKTAVKGTVAVQGNAMLEEFDINANAECDKYSRALTVGGRLSARMGAVHNGFTVAGSGSKIKHNVRLSCSSRVAKYDPTALKIISFDEHRESLIKETGDVCVSPVSSKALLDKDASLIRFVPGNDTYSCYAVFEIASNDLTGIKKLEYTGSNPNQNVLINIKGKYSSIRDLSMMNFNAQRTLLTFCSIYGEIEVFNSRLQGSILAPTTSFTVMDSVFNGSLVAGDVRGKMAILNERYVTC